MKIRDLLKDVQYELVKGSIDLEVSDIFYDSRKVTPGSLFYAMTGSVVDGHDYIRPAIEKGAKAIIVSKDIDIDEDITVIKVKDSRKMLSKISSNLFKEPMKELTSIAITGTKGKTTTAWMIKNILEEDGKKVGVIGTMGIFFGDKHYATVNTTPESYEIQKYAREMVDDGINYLVMEVSSQALKVGRVNDIIFDYGIFTNLTKDHIGENEHPTMEDYIYCKSLLFRQCKHGIFNIDDEHYDSMIKECTCDIYTFGHDKNANLVINKMNLLRKKNFIGVEVSTTGLINDCFLVNTPGEFSAYNSCCAIMTTYLVGANLSSMKKALEKVAVKGRVEIVPGFDNFSVIIDYAHNGVSMESILSTMRGYNPKRIVSLFGCGGNRSKDRRYDMGEVSGRLADFTIVTEDNSRFEDVNDIMNDIEIGLKKTNGKYIKIPDRKDAIKYALDNAIDGDIILLLGKGHETYQEKNGERYHYDEREIIKEIMNN